MTSSATLRPAVIVCADWSRDLASREVYAASPQERRVWRLEPPDRGWTVEAVVRDAQAAANSRRGVALIGFDAPIGVPSSFLNAARCRTFLEWLRGPWSTIDRRPCLTAEEWSVQRPFVAVPKAEGGLKAFEQRMGLFEVEPLRRVDRATRAKPVFVASGIPGTVGFSAMDVWTGLQQLEDEVAVWPLAGSLEDLLGGGKPVVAEIYPRLAYGLALSEAPAGQRRCVRVAKTDPHERKAFLRQLTRGGSWARLQHLELLDQEWAKDSEDAFDAFVTAIALLRCILEGTAISDSRFEDRVAEGGILGSGSVRLDEREEAFKPADAAEATSSWPLTGRFDEALGYATHLHEGTFRKETSIPYVSHLLAVCSRVLEDGGSEDEAIAALLHDAVEDAGGQGRLRAIRARFGERVAAIVAGCSDTDEDPKPPWRERKERYIRHLRAEADASTLRVSLADKLHNACAVLRDHRTSGEAVWERFNAPAGDQLWYYESLVAVFRERAPGPMADELAEVVAEIKGCHVRAVQA